jgi:hypothetical protein
MRLTAVAFECPDQVTNIAQVLGAFVVGQLEARRTHRIAGGRVRNDALGVLGSG